jgi:hypothetical protein
MSLRVWMQGATFVPILSFIFIAVFYWHYILFPSITLCGILFKSLLSNADSPSLSFEIFALLGIFFKTVINISL